ncbi:probable regulator of reproduction DopA [Fusarium fujikuroi]|nr:probable regulator of reproduction DopA [Fusarium fujikuroi]SCN76672.1 probable regulator of reproduction DopA [Fusarium fujikuroi]SCN94932.1 probable regulator of reproduction DopA [Fusarium fujikuroi]SCO48304.1 probable regulator of reproduction DopA [Fusarium fujikuroi]SCV30983.1 probable regulator of reproduction DopA [Fusarium fujikuroi]
MALEPGSGRRSVSPESSGRESPIPRQWRNQLGEEDYAIKDKSYRKYAHGVDRALVLFETALEEWADYISFLNKLLKALQARPKSINAIPSKATVAKRLSQCLNPSLPSGVHQKALELYNLVFSVIGKDGLSRDLPLYLPGLATVLSFASLSVRAPYLDLLERHFLGIDPRSLRPAMKSIILALLPGLEEETSEDFDRTLRLVESFKHAIRPSYSEGITNQHSSGDAFFWQCFFLASITSQSRRSGALAYLVRSLPPLGPRAAPDPNKSATSQSDGDEDTKSKLAEVVTSPEPGLLLRCFASGLSDEQLLIQRGFLDLLVSHLPLNAHVIQSRVKPDDLELLLKAAVGVVTRRDMSLNRRLWAWLLGPEPAAEHEASGDNSSSPPADQHVFLASKTNYFEEFGLQPLTKAILQMIESNSHNTASERAKPYRICLSLMDRWEIGGLVVPEVFLPIIESVRRFKDIASNKTEFNEVLRSASVFFDGIESGLIYGEIAALLAQALGPGALSPPERNDKLSLANFILSNFNVREEEMVTIHAPLCCLTALAMLQDFKERVSAKNHLDPQMFYLSTQALSVAMSLLELVPERVFPVINNDSENRSKSLPTNVEILKKSQSFYVNEQGNIEASASPFNALTIGRAIIEKAAQFVCQDLGSSETDLNACIRLLVLVIHKTPRTYEGKEVELLQLMLELLEHPDIMAFSSFSAILQLSTQLYYAERIETAQLSSLVPLLVRHAWFYLSASEPKYHVEAVRGLWQLQSALSTSNRDIEAALSSLIISQETARLGAIEAVDKGRALSVLWSHTLQDNVSPERRGSKTPTQDMKSLPRLAGADNYEIMLTQPVFLILDALQDDRTPLYMTVKAWLNTMLGIDRLFLLFISRLSDIPFLQTLTQNDEKPNQDQLSFSEDADLDLSLYYLRTLSNILTCAGDISWTVLSSKHVSFHGQHMQISSGGEENEMTLQEFFIRVCMRCITANSPDNATKEFVDRVNQLYRYALSLLHKFLLSPFAASLLAQRLENVLIDRLEKSLQGSDGYVQVLLLDVVYDTLKLRDIGPADVPTSPISERRPSSFDPRGSRPSLSVPEARRISPPPPQLLQCLQDGLSSPSSRPVLDSWVAFVSECLPLYSDSIFQVLIPLVETLCREIGITFTNLRETFSSNALSPGSEKSSPESTLIFLLNGLEQVLARAHQQLLSEEARTQVVKSPDQPQSLFGSMVSNVWQSDTPQSRSATANDRLTVHLAFQDAVRICYKIWTWGQGNDSSKQDQGSFGSFTYTSLRMRNRARRLLEHLFAAENLQCLETVIALWKQSTDGVESTQVFNMLSALEACRPKHCMPALFNAIYRRTSTGAVETASKSTMTISLQDTDLVWFLVEYTRTLDDDAMDEIWQDCMAFLKDLLTNPFPHRQTLPNLLGFAALLGEKVDNTNFGEQRRMRKELGDTFIRLLAAFFTTRPVAFTDSTTSGGGIPKSDSGNSLNGASEGPDDIISILASIVPKLTKILVEPDRVLAAAATISTNVIGPTLRAKGFPDIVSRNTMCLLHELSRVHNNQKNWKKDVGDAFNDPKFFGMDLDLAKEDWLPLLRQWTLTDKEKMPEIVGRINAPSTAGIVFGVGATSARLEADRKTQLNLRRIATLILAGSEDAFVSDLSEIFSKLAELLSASSTSSPSSTTRADIYIVFRALALRTSAIHLGMLWPVVNAEIHAAISSVAAPDNSTASDTYTNASVLQACKLLDLLICVAPDDFQLHEWLFITDTIDAVYRPSTYQPVALVDELSDELGASVNSSGFQSSSVVNPVARGSSRRPLLGPGGINDDVSLDRKDELVAKVLRPFFGQLSIFAFESTYAMGRLDRDACISSLLKDIFDERSIVRAL